MGKILIILIEGVQLEPCLTNPAPIYQFLLNKLNLKKVLMYS